MCSLRRPSQARFAHADYFHLIPRAIRADILEASQHDDPVLITGPTGSGKTWAARVLHEMSTRAAHPYDAVNCAALPTALIESELFGHERGAFTDARERRIGIMEAADGGTILLDEVGALHVRHQAKLLTFLDSMTFKRVGGNRSITIDVRIISATSEDLAYAIRRRRFLDALYYRLAYSVIDIPPLAERRDEIPALVEYILQELQYSHPSKHSATIEADAMTYIQSQPLHGNIRELRYVVRRAARRAGARPISIDDLSFWHPGSIPEMTNGASPELATRQWGQQKRSQVRTIGQEVLIEVLRQENADRAWQPFRPPERLTRT